MIDKWDGKASNDRADPNENQPPEAEQDVVMGVPRGAGVTSGGGVDCKAW